MSFRPDDVQAIAHLARIAIDEERAPEYARDLSSILDFVEQMNRVDTDATEPLSHPLEMAQRLREDAVTESDSREACQAVAPAVEDGLYLVPRVVE